MDLKEKSDRLKGYLERIAPRGDLRALTVADDGLETAGAEHREIIDAREGLDRFVHDEIPTLQQLNGIEAIVHRTDRPVIDVVSDSYPTPGGLWAHLGRTDVRRRIEAAMKSIGRIELPGDPSLEYGGTGFIVGEQLIMTNRHVAELFAGGLGVTGLHFITGRTAGIDFRKEHEGEKPIALEVTGLVMIHPYWDMALLSVGGLTDDRPPLVLATVGPEDLLDRDVVIIGYPAQDPRNDHALQMKIFGGIFNVKRLQPGKVRGRRATHSYGHSVNALDHDSSTLGGNSGSAVVDVLSGTVVGLHFGGEYLVANYAVPTRDLARDPRVVNASLRFDGPSVEVDDPWATAWERADGSETTDSSAARNC